jgi:hypothetical protein
MYFKNLAYFKDSLDYIGLIRFDREIAILIIYTYFS